MIKQAVFFTDEIWSPVQIEGVKQGLYEVSNFGRVRNNHGDIIKPCIINTGYYVYRLFTGISGRYKHVLAHRLVMMTFYPIPNCEEYTVNHCDGVKDHNYDRNLEWCTQGENNAHAKLIGHNNNYGPNHYKSKFTEDQVRRICELLSIGNISYRDIIIDLGLDPNMDCYYDMIGNIKRRITYKSISKDYSFQ